MTNESDILELLRALPLVIPEVPRQRNLVDCGVYTLQYAEEFFQRWPSILKSNVRNNAIDGFDVSMFNEELIKVCA